MSVKPKRIRRTTPLILKRVPIGPNLKDYDVLEDGAATWVGYAPCCTGFGLVTHTANTQDSHRERK